MGIDYQLCAEAVCAACAQRGAQIVFELAAPGLYGEQSTHDWQAGFEWWRDECQARLARVTETPDKRHVLPPG